MFIKDREKESTKKLLVSIILIITISLSSFGLNFPSLIFADANHAKAVNLKNIKNFSFHYSQYGGRFYPDEVSISYSSDKKEITYRDPRQFKSFIRPVSTSEEKNMIQIINNNRFFQTSHDLRIKCCNLTNTKLTVTINNMTHTLLWNINAPIEVYKIAYAIIHLAKSQMHLANFTRSINNNDNKINIITAINHTAGIDNNSTANFFFEYALDGRGIHGKYDRIAYNSNTKELVVECNAPVFLIEALCGPGKLGISHIRVLDNTEEDNLRQIINNNGFFKSAVFPEHSSCSNCYTETLTVKLNDTTKTIRWGLTHGVTLSYSIFDTLRVINYVASK
jgi:hypothetical protein